MNKEKILSMHNAASITAGGMLEAIENICEQLNSCETAEEMTEAAGTILGDVTKLIGSAHLLLIDVDAVVKADE